MQQRQLGAQGPHISAIGIGAMSFSDFYGATSEAESHAILTAALDQGVTHIDTADVYGGGTLGTGTGTAKMTIADAGDGKSTISYDADGDVGGLVAGVGQRVLMGVAKHLTRQFFTALKAHFTSP